MARRQWSEGRYEGRWLLGRGGAAEVWQATDQLLRRDVAVKSFAGGSLAGGADDVARFRAEVQLLANLHHPHIVRVWDAGISDDSPWYVMQLAEAGSLARRAAADTGPGDDRGVLAGIAAQVADALAHLHAAGIVHRDVKPSNILLDAEGRAYLSDFGVARVCDGTHITRTGMLVGTAAYLAPEQVRGEQAGPPADVYALGLVLLEQFTGRREYPGSPAEAAVARLTRPPDPPPWLGPGWVRLITDMTALAPADRPGAEEIRDRIPEVLRSAALAPPGPPAPVPAGPVPAGPVPAGPVPAGPVPAGSGPVPAGRGEPPAVLPPVAPAPVAPIPVAATSGAAPGRRRGPRRILTAIAVAGGAACVLAAGVLAGVLLDGRVAPPATGADLRQPVSSAPAPVPTSASPVTATGVPAGPATRTATSHARSHVPSGRAPTRRQRAAPSPTGTGPGRAPSASSRTPAGSGAGTGAGRTGSGSPAVPAPPAPPSTDEPPDGPGQDGGGQNDGGQDGGGQGDGARGAGQGSAGQGSAGQGSAGLGIEVRIGVAGPGPDRGQRPG